MQQKKHFNLPNEPTDERSQQKQRFLPTEELAIIFHVKPETIRRGLCVNGHYMGIQPLKLPNGRLLWPEESAYKVFSAENTK